MNKELSFKLSRITQDIKQAERIGKSPDAKKDSEWESKVKKITLESYTKRTTQQVLDIISLHPPFINGSSVSVAVDIQQRSRIVIISLSRTPSTRACLFCFLACRRKSLFHIPSTVSVYLILCLDFMISLHDTRVAGRCAMLHLAAALTWSQRWRLGGCLLLMPGISLRLSTSNI